MWSLLALFACGTPSPPPAPEPAPIPESARVEVHDPPPPRPAPRDPSHGEGALAVGAGGPEQCTDGCTSLRFRPQASSERLTGATRGAAELVMDGDPTTAWCAVGGAGEQLSLALPAATTLRGLTIRHAPDAPRWRAFTLVTDARDRWRFEVPDVEEAGIALSLPDVQFVQLEVEALDGPGWACLAEVSLAGR